MPPLTPYNPLWPKQAEVLIKELTDLLGSACIEIHHIGSTSVRGLTAKPVIDLLPVVTSHAALDAKRPALESAGFEWMGNFGLPGRTYLHRDHACGTRQVQAHCYEQGSAEIKRHLAFRDLLRRDSHVRAAYGATKARCLGEHPNDHAAYGACKSALIDTLEARALLMESPIS
ncbi:GrpB family protein [Alisedimentitalea sp. MJ-SS2]|uniref:GrpB family protein n=1 Tax=Aliisedimentitalea sp. MJ-SS2 TaxID=3049795 RepID=UPI00290BED05|nr:GrpB family protein [Alisedimentitalea sp. MJ-SS2]MDU8926543.1 GrpB family protein [Alisedimentitalea sp. MJ-SS2]